MTDLIVYRIRLERMRKDYAEIPVVAANAEEARRKAEAKRYESHHTWHTFESSIGASSVIEADRMATEWEAKNYKPESPNDEPVRTSAKLIGMDEIKKLISDEVNALQIRIAKLEQDEAMNVLGCISNEELNAKIDENRQILDDMGTDLEEKIEARIREFKGDFEEMIDTAIDTTISNLSFSTTID